MSATSVNHPGWPAAVSAWLFAQWLILSWLVTSKGIIFVFGLTQSVAISCHKNESHCAFSLTSKCFCNDYAIWIVIFWRKIIEVWTFNGKYRSILNKVRTLSGRFPSLYARVHIPLGARVQPTVTNDQHLWSRHKGYLWRFPQHTQQIDLTNVINFLTNIHKRHRLLWI